MVDTSFSLTILHYVYLIGVIAILLTMVFKKDTVLPSLFFIAILGFFATGSITGGITTIFNAVVYSGIQLMDIITTIALVTALSKCLGDLGSDYLMMAPAVKIMKTPQIAFWVVGIVTLIFALFFWPSPAVALVGAILVPAAIKCGLSALGTAVAMNIFAHGVALSSDYVIQGTSAVTSSANSATPEEIMIQGTPLFLTMAVVTSVVSFFMCRGEMRSVRSERESVLEKRKITKQAKIMAVLTPITFAVVIFAMFHLDLKGGDATSLMGGTAVILMCIGAIISSPKDSFNNIRKYTSEGFFFGMKIFAPIIVIAAFFYLGSDGISQIIPDYSETQGFMNEWALWLSNTVTLSEYPVAFIVMLIGGVTGLDGSGFSALPLIGALAGTFAEAINVSVPVLSALGQITAVWVGGGVIVP